MGWAALPLDLLRFIASGVANDELFSLALVCKSFHHVCTVLIEHRRSTREQVAQLALVCFDAGRYADVLQLFVELVTLRVRHWSYKWVQLFLFGINRMSAQHRVSMRVIQQYVHAASSERERCWSHAYLQRVVDESLHYYDTVLSLIERYKYEMYPVFVARWQLVFRRYRLDALQLKHGVSQQLLADELHNLKNAHERLLRRVLADDDDDIAGHDGDDAVEKCSKNWPLQAEIVLSAGVFLYERVAGAKQQAVDTLRAYVDDSLTRLDQLSENDYKTVTLILQMIRDNVSIWEEELRAAEQQG